MDFSLRKQELRQNAFSSVRRSAAALGRAKEERSNLIQWDPIKLDQTDKVLEKHSKFGRDIDGISNYFANNFGGGLEYIWQPNFTLTYYLFGDVSRDGIVGECTNAVNVNVCWDKSPVEAVMIPGKSRPTVLHHDILTMNREGVHDRDKIAKATGWDRTTVRNLPGDRLYELGALMKQAEVGQQKMTRLIKGFLFMLDCMEQGKITVDRNQMNVLLYDPIDVLNRANVSGRSFIYCSAPSEHEYVGMLHIMCEAYPPPEVTSHITIPADGAVWIVGGGAMPGNDVFRDITPFLAYSAILRYAMDMNITGDLQGALICACSLRENRYLSRVGLPKTLSQIDLLAPAMIKQSDNSQRPMISLHMAVGVGRLHQMLSFMTARDVITSGLLSTKPGVDPTSSILQFMSAQAQLVDRMGSYFTDLCLLEATPFMRYLEFLNREDIQDLASISVFEGLWLCDRSKKVIRNGAIAALKLGMLDMSDSTLARDNLLSELAAAGTTIIFQKCLRAISLSKEWLSTNTGKFESQIDGGCSYQWSQ